ncbi:MAG: histidine--tRNA ligase [Candidatus ainarchaeum sp.]|nr:histidine--tRNA ligase [Candidatus ainarchaeum sp.]
MDTPKGMRDFLPKEMMVREEVFQKIREAFREFGYVPLETPALEYLSTLNAKNQGGEEIAGQIFALNDEKLGLRFDLTVPLARVAASTSFPKPFKRYQIGRVWRREEPQKGRYREFWQADVDVIGCASMRAEAELLEVASLSLRRLGFREFKILLNNRKMLNGALEAAGIKEKQRAMRILDKADKVGEKEAERMLRAEFGKKGEGLLRMLPTHGTNEDKLAAVEQYSAEGVNELREIISFFPHVEIDLRMVRGLGYYSGPIYEIKAPGLSGSIAAGGRYDGLLSIYGKAEPATGISLGVERIALLLSEKHDAKTYTRVFVASLPDAYAYALSVVRELREAGIPAETDLMGRALAKQLDYANSKGIPFVAVVGKKEMEEKKVTLKDMKSGGSSCLSIEEALKRLR